jgi:hypothetical protein
MNEAQARVSVDSILNEYQGYCASIGVPVTTSQDECGALNADRTSCRPGPTACPENEFFKLTDANINGGLQFVNNKVVPLFTVPSLGLYTAGGFKDAGMVAMTSGPKKNKMTPRSVTLAQTLTVARRGALLSVALPLSAHVRTRTAVSATALLYHVDVHPVTKASTFTLNSSVAFTVPAGPRNGWVTVPVPGWILLPLHMYAVGVAVPYQEDVYWAGTEGYPAQVTTDAYRPGGLWAKDCMHCDFAPRSSTGFPRDVFLRFQADTSTCLVDTIIHYNYLLEIPASFFAHASAHKAELFKTLIDLAHVVTGAKVVSNTLRFRDHTLTAPSVRRANGNAVVAFNITTAPTSTDVPTVTCLHRLDEFGYPPSAGSLYVTVNGTVIPVTVIAHSGKSYDTFYPPPPPPDDTSSTNIGVLIAAIMGGLLGLCLLILLILYIHRRQQQKQEMQQVEGFSAQPPVDPYMVDDQHLFTPGPGSPDEYTRPTGYLDSVPADKADEAVLRRLSQQRSSVGSAGSPQRPQSQEFAPQANDDSRMAGMVNPQYTPLAATSPDHPAHRAAPHHPPGPPHAHAHHSAPGTPTPNGGAYIDVEEPGNTQPRMMPAIPFGANPAEEEETLQTVKRKQPAVQSTGYLSVEPSKTNEFEINYDDQQDAARSEEPALIVKKRVVVDLSKVGKSSTLSPAPAAVAERAPSFRKTSFDPSSDAAPASKPSFITKGASRRGKYEVANDSPNLGGSHLTDIFGEDGAPAAAAEPATPAAESSAASDAVEPSEPSEPSAAKPVVAAEPSAPTDAAAPPADENQKCTYLGDCTCKDCRGK